MFGIFVNFNLKVKLIVDKVIHRKISMLQFLLFVHLAILEY